jgi:hypothetical protein
MATVVGGALAALAFLLGAAAVKTVEAERFLLKDAKGRVRVAFGPQADGLACVICDANGKPRTRIGINDDGTIGFKSFDETTLPAPAATPATSPKAPPVKR